jgi:hypothetical protein
MESFDDKRCGDSLRFRQLKLAEATELTVAGCDKLREAWNPAIANYDPAGYAIGQALIDQGHALRNKYSLKN